MANESGRRLVVPDSYIYELGEAYVEPNCKTFVWENEKKEIHYWTKPLPDILGKCLNPHLDEVRTERIESVDLVIEEDHGQGKFRSRMKIILRNCDGKNIHYFCIKLNHIDYEKDTYEVLKDSIIGPLSEDIELIYMNPDVFRF